MFTNSPTNKKSKGNAAQSLCERCEVRFFSRLYRNSAGILSYVKGFLCKMAENMQADFVQTLCGVAYNSCSIAKAEQNDFIDNVENSEKKS